MYCVTLGLGHTWIVAHLDWGTLGLVHTRIGSHLDWVTLGLGHTSVLVFGMTKIPQFVGIPLNVTCDHSEVSGSLHCENRPATRSSVGTDK